MKQRKIFHYALQIVLVLLLTACGSNNHQAADEKNAELTIVAGKNSNPDVHGRAAPVEVFIYMLTGEDNFNSSDYFTITSGNNPELKSDITQRKQIILKPGTSRTLKFTIEKEVRYIAVVAAFRNINQAQWSALYALPNPTSRSWYQNIIPAADETLQLEVSVDQLSVSIKEVN